VAGVEVGTYKKIFYGTVVGMIVIELMPELKGKTL
jgi:tetrahydromethanopterin S-methyltransferase subunit G